ncbi:protein EFR3 homolog B-like [Hylaeus anthracinus]|uniref:protein EFR3 homolog B-like n=1 Tax=Hylaeus anthracinus TaxID=313031 RepID=UPI0023B95EAF|nr:protein EFR3 homolog B-like [Hylaeus anthracinus]
MISDQKLKSKIEYLHTVCSMMLSHSLRDQDKILNNIITITKSALQEQLLTYEPNVIIICALKLFLYYDENLSYTGNLCEWKRRKKRRLAKECYNSLLQIYIPKKSKEILEAVLDMIYEDKLWEFETFCFEVMCNLLECGLSGALMIHAIWDKIEAPNMNIEDTRKIIRILYELLDIYIWPGTHDTVLVIERILNLFYISVTTTQFNNSISYAMLKKGLEVCIINIVKHICNDHLLIIIQHMCSWAVEEGTTDEIILEFGSTLEYTSYMHEVTLYEKTLTPKIFPLLMKMIGSKSKITSLLGNRVIQYLLDRKDNKINFDTPKIFFEDTQFDLTISECFKEDKLFCKLHREILHDSLLKSIISHCSSRMNLETTYCTICLIAIEIPCGFTAAAIVCLIMNLQDLTLKQHKDNPEVSYHLHATVIAIMSLLCWIHKARVFYEYVNKIMLERAQWAPHLNPPFQSQYNFAAHHILWNKPDLFFVDWEARYGLWKCFRLRRNEDDEDDI